MNGQVADLERVTNAILTEIQGVMGLAQTRLAQWPIRSIFGSPARRLAGLLVQLDQDIARYGLSAAAENLLSRFVQDFLVDCPQGIPDCTHGIPKDGPLLVVSNHPGAYDLLILVANLLRDDLKIISSDIAVFRHLPFVAPHFITITDDPYRRMVSFRTALRHLWDGKALLIFPRGEVEIDPALSADAVQGIDRWSFSLDLMLRKAPQTQSMVAIVSGVFSPRWFNHPILRLWKKPEQRQKIAEIIQVAEQLILSKKPPLTPRVSFSPPLIFSETGQKSAPPGWRMETLTQTARAQLATITR
jgi:hypothetical protein